ncbi:hypothetical protein CP985_04135 [Malaciobacter mytili LMG 24559]|uniref:site-specific DNA-methyltransferase (adenine-specific) n=1 Tax=Malaciobacter mytili LMG 24559 TaxID=1032238 RepID=A0AAX2AH90_9BACT|nr:DNA adenine methylase [Malaciobacter mytili]AXH13743.1 hypothetical protein AMYT_0118 [Malaciobacter mytili LMG 24559]RXK16352.1 hypothetical protein CP985_04135 [Malaciobacter mytili LMG 24559]
MIKSLLKLVEKKLCSPKEVIRKGFKLIQKNFVEKTNPIIIKNINKTRTSQLMYVNQSLVKYSKDNLLHNHLNSLSESELSIFLKNKDNNICNTESFSDDSDTKKIAFVPYGGSKQNHKSTQQMILSDFFNTNPNSFKSYYESFLGGFGSVYNSLPILIENGIKDLYLSDINPSLINTFRQVQRNPKQVQRHLASIDLEYMKLFNKFQPSTKEEGKEWFKRIHKEFTELEISKKMNPRRASLFLYLMHNVQGGMLNFNMKTKLNSFSFCFCEKKLRQVPLMINKVEIFNKIFNLVNIKFSISKYETVLRKVNKDNTALVLFDPPYVNYEEESTSKDFLSCSYNYGINNFNHRGLLNKIKNGKYSFIYYNNHNPHLEDFSKKQNYNYLKKDVLYKNGTTATKSIEILMYKNRNTELKLSSLNTTNYLPIKIAS